jgi:hypothetical protein
VVQQQFFVVNSLATKSSLIPTKLHIISTNKKSGVCNILRNHINIIENLRKYQTCSKDIKILATYGI